MDEVKEIAMRIKELREISDYTEEDVAKRLGVPVEEYRQYETDGKGIPINVLYQLSKMYKVDFSEGEGKIADRYPGYHFQDLAFHYNNEIMQPFIVTLDPSDKPADLVSHRGEEFNLVLKGTVIVTHGDQELVLHAGDSIYFNPTYPHGQRCGGDEPAIFLTMIAE